MHTALVTATQLVSSHILNQARFQFARYSDRRTDLQPSVYVSRAGYSLEGATLGPYGFGATPEDTYEAADTLSHTSGRHAVKVGGGFKFVRAHNESLPVRSRRVLLRAARRRHYPQPYAFVQGVAASSSRHGRRSAQPVVVRVRAGRVAHRAASQANYGRALRHRADQPTSSATTLSSDRNNLQPRVERHVDAIRRAAVGARPAPGIYTQQHLLYYINRDRSSKGPKARRSSR